jgi:hypothetical protein
MADSTLGVDGIVFADMFAGIGTVSTSGASCEDDDKESGKMKVVKARCCEAYTMSGSFHQVECDDANLVGLLRRKSIVGLPPP